MLPCKQEDDGAGKGEDQSSAGTRGVDGRGLIFGDIYAPGQLSEHARFGDPKKGPRFQCLIRTRARF